MSTYGTSSPWTPPAEQREPVSEAPEYDATGDPAGTADAEEGSGDAALSGAAADDVVVVESVRTGEQAGEQGSAGYDAFGADVDGPPFRSTATSSTATSAMTAGGDAGDLTPPAADAAPADTALPDSAVPTGATPAASDNAAEWSEIKALFVDDPSTSVRRASALVERAVDGFMTSLRQRQDALSSWREGDAAGTEDLRVALRGYRGLFEQLEHMSGQFPAHSAGSSPGGPGTGRPVAGS